MPLDPNQKAQRRRERLLKRRGYQMPFPGQHEGERVILTLRRHWTAFLFEIFILIGATFLPIAGYVLTVLFAPFLLESPYINVIVLLLSLYALFVTLYFFIVWIDRYFDVWVITAERVIDVEQKSFFNRITSEVELDKIQDVTVHVKGILPTLFRYGTIEVQTAAVTKNFHIQDIKDPYIVKDILVELERAYTLNTPGQRQEVQARIEEIAPSNTTEEE